MTHHDPTPPSDHRLCVEALQQRLEKVFDEVQTQVDLARRTTLRVGGAAELFLQVGEADQVLAALTMAVDAGVACSPLGLGSNVIIHDDGVPGLVLRLTGGLTEVQMQPEGVDATAREGAGTVIEVGAGAVNAHLVRTLHSAGLIGAEFLALVPGTVGGAVAMNAGTKWGETSDLLVAVQIADPETETLRWLSRDELQMGYRLCALPTGSVVTRARLRVEQGDPLEAAKKVRNEKAFREQTQPYKLATNGSVFTNPPGDYAGRLIEAVGLKGMQVGGAVISPKHANWIVNGGDATAADVLTLMAMARRRVYDRFGVWLKSEVRLLGGRGLLRELDAAEAGLRAP